MSVLNSIKIGQRLILGFATVLILSVAVGAFAVSRLTKVNDNTTDLATNWLAALRALSIYSGEEATVRRAEARYVMATSLSEAHEQVERADKAKANAAAAWKTYVSTITPGEEQKLAAEVNAGQNRYYVELAKVLSVPSTDADSRLKLATVYKGESSKAFNALTAVIQSDMDLQTRGGDAAYRDSQQTFSSARAWVICLLAAAVAVGAFLALVISKSITVPISVALRVAETVAGGDLTSLVDSQSPDEAGQLLRALKRMNDSLARIVTQVRNSSDSIATGSGQIAAGNTDLSQRTEEQAGNLQQTAASMEELTATVRHNADTARSATQIASVAAEAAANGGRVVGRVVATMDEITESSKQISDIIGVIDGIAFQTNILALNAAVEAARAGEQGRGFAVVATEVRSLAQRSASAAKQIKTLIGASVERVESGARLVDEAGHSMSNIVTQVTRVNDLIGEISSASIEQSTGIGQIGDAVNQLDQVTQQNAALVEESAAAAESLKIQAGQLAEMVAAFKLNS